MATVNFDVLGEQRDSCKTVKWAGVVGADSCTPFEFAAFPDKSVQVIGPTFVSAVTIQGSNDGTNYVTLTDNLGLPLSFTAAGIKFIAENTRYIKPVIAAGASVNTIIITGNK